MPFRPSPPAPSPRTDRARTPAPQTSLDDVRVQVNALKILQHLAAADEAASIMERCKKLYAHGLPFGASLYACFLSAAAC